MLKHFRIYLLNIRSINAIKLHELIRNTESLEQNTYKIICLTETHERFAKVDIPQGYRCVTRRRNENDKKGGGLMMLYDDCISAVTCETVSKDLLYVDIEFEKQNFKIILAYMDVADNSRNELIKSELKNIITEVEESNRMMVLGDFNGHVGFLGRQELDIGGRYILELLEENMILLNGDDRCRGEVTREENGVESTIDYILVNKRMYDIFMHMEIDEQKFIYDMSDHCLIWVDINLECERKGREKKRETVEYYSQDENKCQEYVSSVENMLQAVISTEEVNWNHIDDILNPQSSWKQRRIQAIVSKQRITEHINKLPRKLSNHLIMIPESCAEQSPGSNVPSIMQPHTKVPSLCIIDKLQVNYPRQI